MSPIKFNFGTKVIAKDGQVFTVTKIECTEEENRYYVPGDEHDGYWTEDFLQKYSEPVSRENLIKAWKTVNGGVTWRNSEEAAKIQGLLRFFGFEEIT